MFARSHAAQHDAPFQRARFVLNALDHRAEPEIALALRVKAGRGRGNAHELAELGVAVGGQRGNRDDADFLQCEIQQHELGHIGQLQHRRLQRAKTEFKQVQRQPVADPIDFGIAVLALSIDDGDAAGVFPEDDREFLRQRPVLPVALFAAHLRVLGREGNDSFEHLFYSAQVDAVKPPSMTMISPVTKRLPWIRLIIVSATSSAVTQRLSGVDLARLPMSFSYLSLSMRCIQSPSIQPGATALTRISGPRFQARVLVKLTTAALLAA